MNIFLIGDFRHAGGSRHNGHAKRLQAEYVHVHAQPAEQSAFVFYYNLFRPELYTLY